VVCGNVEHVEEWLVGLAGYSRQEESCWDLHINSRCASLKSMWKN
jgi:hypothetical protein